MKTKAIVQDRFGGPEQLRYSEVDVDAPGPGEVLVRVAASSVNPFDVRIREGEALTEHTPLPFVPGWDVAGGGVGHLAVQIAAAAGAEVTVIASRSKHEWLRSLGAHEAVDFRDTAAMSGLRGFDVALNLAPGSWDATLEAVAPGGDLITNSGGASAGIRHHITSVDTKDTWLAGIVDLVEHGQLHPLVSSSYPLERAADAYRELEGGHATGKIALVVA